MKKRLLLAPAVLGILTLIGCQRQDNAKIQHDAAKATAEAKQETKAAAANTKQVLAQAENAVDAAASGVKQGIHEHVGDKPVGSDSDTSIGKTSAGKIDLNTASESQLTSLPGIDIAKADAIVAARPYDTPRDLVRKGVLTPAQYHRIAAEVAISR